MSAILDLIGQQLIRTELVHDYVQLHFDDFLLNVFNPCSLNEDARQTDTPRIVVSVEETSAYVKIALTDRTIISIDLRPEAWSGPEAMVLYRGDTLIVVWN